MEIAITIIGVLLIIMSVFLVVAVLMQSSKDHRLGASIAGGAETFFGKAKGKSMDALFNKLTTVIAILFVVLVLVLYFIQPGTTINEPVVSGGDIVSDANMEDVDANDDADASDANLAENVEVENAEDVVDNAEVENTEVENTEVENNEEGTNE